MSFSADSISIDFITSCYTSSLRCLVSNSLRKTSWFRLQEKTFSVKRNLKTQKISDDLFCALSHSKSFLILFKKEKKNHRAMLVQLSRCRLNVWVRKFRLVYARWMGSPYVLSLKKRHTLRYKWIVSGPSIFSLTLFKQHKIIAKKSMYAFFRVWVYDEKEATLWQENCRSHTWESIDWSLNC